mmetsp:Transcript_26227/g.68991  ORF Transcript_26227/g.68991 Transcript_26227/m.68991 type:complete len:240 (-) Transcript_26227:178-897(-)
MEHRAERRQYFSPLKPQLRAEPQLQRGWIQPLDAVQFLRKLAPTGSIKVICREKGLSLRRCLSTLRRWSCQDVDHAHETRPAPNAAQVAAHQIAVHAPHAEAPCSQDCSHLLQHHFRNHVCGCDGDPRTVRHISVFMLLETHIDSFSPTNILVEPAFGKVAVGRKISQVAWSTDRHKVSNALLAHCSVGFLARRDLCKEWLCVLHRGPHGLFTTSPVSENGERDHVIGGHVQLSPPQLA